MAAGTEVEAALSAEEWAELARGDIVLRDGWPESGRPHALAARCLHDQPFGFTRKDLEALEYRGIGYDEGHDQAALDSLYARIEALLPPEEG
jgi:hypothetical protein